MTLAKLSKSALWSLFLMAALPTHAWTILLILQDVSWVTERTNQWDAIGVGAYGLLAALAESIFVFLIALVLNLLLPRTWEERQRLVALTSLFFLTASASILNQLYFLLGATLPASIFRILVQSGHPLRILYGVTFVVGLGATGVVLFLSARSQKYVDVALNVIERLSVLMTLYLLLDFGGLVLVIIRNV